MNTKIIGAVLRIPSAFTAGLVAIACILLTYAGIDTPSQLWAVIQPITFAKIGMLAGIVWSGHFLHLAWLMSRAGQPDGGTLNVVAVVFTSFAPWLAYAIEQIRS